MRGSEQTWESLREKMGLWLRQGMSPRRLALSLSLGFVIGCIPLIGIPTGLCAMIALAFGLNQPAIQAANYAAMPFQIALVVPFMRLGSKLTPSLANTKVDLAALSHSPFQLLTHSSKELVSQFGLMAGEALLAWLVVAIPVALVLTIALTGVLRRVPAVAEAEARN